MAKRQWTSPSSTTFFWILSKVSRSWFAPLQCQLQTSSLNNSISFLSLRENSLHVPLISEKNCSRLLLENWKGTHSLESASTTKKSQWSRKPEIWFKDWRESQMAQNLSIFKTWNPTCKRALFHWSFWNCTPWWKELREVTRIFFRHSPMSRHWKSLRIR